jgi:hypothetical protein
MTLLELNAALVHYCGRGQALELPGIGFFRPSLRNTGQIRIAYRADKGLKVAIGSFERYRGEVENLHNLGLGPLELKALWDEAYPHDPLDMPMGFKGGDTRAHSDRRAPLMQPRSKR